MPPLSAPVVWAFSFSGISSVNNGMILAGAIPACILALAIDWVLSQVESLVTPVSLQPELLKTRSTLTAKRRRQKWSVGVVVALLVFMFGQNVYANLVKDPNTIRIGSKQFTEQLVLGNMLGE